MWGVEEDPSPEGPPEEGDWAWGGARSTRWITLPPTSAPEEKKVERTH